MLLQTRSEGVIRHDASLKNETSNLVPSQRSEETAHMQVAEYSRQSQIGEAFAAAYEILKPVFVVFSWANPLKCPDKVQGACTVAKLAPKTSVHVVWVISELLVLRAKCNIQGPVLLLLHRFQRL